MPGKISLHFNQVARNYLKQWTFPFSFHLMVAIVIKSWIKQESIGRLLRQKKKRSD